MEEGKQLTKKEFTLAGLDCANCAMKIEKGVASISGVDKCSVNFATQTLSLSMKQRDEAEIIEKAQKEIRRLEPHIKVEEKQKGHISSATFLLEGLDCANCAAKIEKEVGKLDGVASASVDFVSKKLTIEASNHQLEAMQEQAEKVVEKLEPHVHVLPLEKEKHHHTHAHDHSHEHGAGHTKKMIVRLSVGSIVAAIGVFAPFSVPLEFLFFFAAYLIIGGDIVWRAVKNIIRGQVFDEHFLMAIATIGAFAVGQYAEGVAVMLFYQIGELFQGIAVNRSRKSISSLMDIRPDFANVKREETFQKISPEDVRIGDIILVKPGEKIPLDGKVIEGASMVDTSALTGESIPRDIKAGSDVLSGFINKNGVLTIEVTKEFGESTVSKILDLVQNASSKKAPTENFITKFARYYTPVVVIIAFLLAVVPPLIISGATFSDWVYRALIFLVISCPCALVVSIPLGFFGGIGAASSRGILVKGSNYLEALNDVKYVVFDKTGTLTKGVFEVTKIHAVEGVTQDEVLQNAAFAEVHSNHPIAESIRKAYGKDISENSISSYNEISGHGMEVVIEEKEILAGNRKLMSKMNIPFLESEEVGTVVYVAVNKIFIGYIVISDQLKDDAKKAIQLLKELNMKKTVMLTGDALAVGKKVAKELAMDEVYAELLPQHKVEQMEQLDRTKQTNEKILFVGDGINDTPVLARADVGMAMGGLGSDAAIEAADIVIMTDEPSKIATAIKIAKKTRKIVWQNIIFALGVKAVFLLLGAFGIATMWEAVFSDVGVTLLAVLNAMRVLKTNDL
ncbi:heavy metal translocating P-type ATPase [Niallia nealsonii]|uniref:heavy metal translocating P-type ATPase n=1 Tax=Niallia nealsonii TaxID=115979 RepID=UPI001F2DCC54|nr:heavy metal translocating P-type ATPase [Niallia nealsonii]